MHTFNDVVKDSSRLGTLTWATTAEGHSAFTLAQYQAALYTATRAFQKELDTFNTDA
jgi:hypothetical protein